MIVTLRSQRAQMVKAAENVNAFRLRLLNALLSGNVTHRLIISIFYSCLIFVLVLWCF